MTDPQTNHKPTEVFSTELPSQCNIYLSGKQSSKTATTATNNNPRRHRIRRGGRGKKTKASSSSSSPSSSPSSLPLLRFATDRHSLNLLKNHEDCAGKKGDGGNSIGRRGDDYSLSIGRLPSSSSPSSSSSSSSRNNNKSPAATVKQSTTTNKNNDREEKHDDTICLAHSSVYWEGSQLFSDDDDDVGEGTTDDCCSHPESSMEVFAMTRIPPSSNSNSSGGGAENNNDVGKDYKSSSDNNSLITHGSNSLSEGGKDVGDTTAALTDHSKSVEASSSTAVVDSSSTKINDSGVGEKQPLGSGNASSSSSSSSSSSNYYLMLKSKVVADPEHKNPQINNDTHLKDGVVGHGASSSSNNDKPTKITTRVETIPLDFRPMSVHATEVHISSTSTNGNDDGSRPSPSRCPAIGVFVASVDDNKLRLYVATEETLRGNGTQSSSDPCFVAVPLFNDASSSVSSSGAVQRGIDDERPLDENDDPLVFSTPIMAMDACVTTNDEREEEDLSETTVVKERSCAMKANRLAVACYDGTVRILTYQVKEAQSNNQNNSSSNNRNASSVQFCLLRCSTFVVDGPVVSLHFGMTPRMTTTTTPLQRSSSLFLVAGSLCGFACVFYETLVPSSSSSNDGSRDSGDVSSRYSFGGPLTVVDGLYDARQDGYEDCVTSVHVMSGSDADANGSWAPTILVGTQGGRVLLFGQCRKKKNIVGNGNENLALMLKREKDELAFRIDQDEKEISRLQSEKEETISSAKVLNEVISEMRKEIEDLEGTESLHTANADCSLQLSSSSESGDTTGDVEDEEILDETTSLEGEKEEAEPTRDMDEMPNFETKLESARTELLLLEQKISDCASAIAELTSAVENNTRKTSINAQRTNKLGIDSIHAAGIEIRQTHRYEFLWEHHLPYPIHGIASSARERQGDGGRDIFVSTRRSFHVLHIIFRSAQDAIGASVVDKMVESLEENLATLLAI